MIVSKTLAHPLSPVIRENRQKCVVNHALIWRRVTEILQYKDDVMCGQQWIHKPDFDAQTKYARQSRVVRMSEKWHRRNRREACAERRCVRPNVHWVTDNAGSMRERLDECFVLPFAPYLWLLYLRMRLRIPFSELLGEWNKSSDSSASIMGEYWSRLEDQSDNRMTHEADLISEHYSYDAINHFEFYRVVRCLRAASPANQRRNPAAVLHWCSR